MRGNSELESTEKKHNKHQKKSKKKDLRKVEVTWNVPNTEGCDFATVIRDFNSLSSTEKLKAKTKYTNFLFIGFYFFSGIWNNVMVQFRVWKNPQELQRD